MNETLFYNILCKLYMYMKKNNLLKNIIKPQQSCKIVYAILLQSIYILIINPIK